MNPIPYNQNTFNIIAKNSRCFYNNKEVSSSKMKFYAANGNTNMNNEFLQSLLADLDMFISDIQYDVNAKQKTKDYICNRVMPKYGNFVDKNIMPHLSQLDYKYNYCLGNRFLQDLFAAYLYDNVMIND